MGANNTGKTLSVQDILDAAKGGSLSRIVRQAAEEEQPTQTPTVRRVRRVVAQQEEKPTVATAKPTVKTTKPKPKPVVVQPEPEEEEEEQSNDLGIVVTRHDGYVWVGMPETNTPSKSGKSILVGYTHGPQDCDLVFNGKKCIVNAMVYYYPKGK